MSVFINDRETKRVIFNIEVSLAERLERAKEVSRSLGKKLDVDTTVDKALEKFLKKAEKKLAEMHEEFAEEISQKRPHEFQFLSESDAEQNKDQETEG